MNNPYGWPVDPIEPLTYITDRLNNRKPFIYLRFNDGEFYSMLGMKTAPETNGEHVYSDSIADALIDTFGQLVGDATGEDALIGSWWYEDMKHEASIEFQKFLASLVEKDDRCAELTKRFLPSVRWSRGHIWHREELEKEGKCLTDELLRFIDAVMNFKGYKFLVGNQSLYTAASALGLNSFWIEDQNAGENGFENPNMDCCEDQLYIWCAGFPAKPWAWKSWIASNRTSYHIDAGSLFDGLCGRESREWLKRNGSAHSKFYYGEFARYLGIPV